MKTYSVEMTDLFGGEANYGWLNRQTIVMPDNATDRSIIMAAKKALRMTGIPCRRVDMSALIELRPTGSQTVIFINLDPVEA